MEQMAGHLQSPLRPITALVVHALLVHFCRGQPQLIGPAQPIEATVGSDIILPCHLKPAVDVAAKTLEWTRPDLDPRFVFLWRANQDNVNLKNPSYSGRTSLFTDELKNGNMSLKLSNVKPADEGTYICFIPELNTNNAIELVVGAASSPVISGRVVLQCNSTGWYPEPEVFWLDGEGNLLSAGPPETVRGPDDLYTVSSRVTVEKRHSNSFTCRVTQNRTKETRETQTQISDHFFEVRSSSTTVGLAVVVAFCILIILFLVFVLWRQNTMKAKKSHKEEADEGERIYSTRNKTEDKFVFEEEKERERLMTGQTLQMNELNKEKKQQKSKDEQQRREETDIRVKTLKEELETKRREVEMKQSELQQLHEEVQQNEENVKTVKENLEQRNKEDSRKTELQKKKKKEVKNSGVDDLKQKLEMEVTELHSKNQEIHVKQVEVQQLQNEIQRMLTDLQTLVEELESNNTKANSPAKGLIVKVSDDGEYIRLVNLSGQDQILEGWKLQIHVNDEGRRTFKFGSESYLKHDFCVCFKVSSGKKCPSPRGMQWMDLSSWKSADKLEVVLISKTREIQCNSFSQDLS